MLIIWLQGIWLPLHGYSYEDDAALGRHLPAAAHRSASSSPGRSPARSPTGSAPAPFATGGLLLVAATFVGLLLIPVNFEYWLFALITFLNGIGSGMFSCAEPHGDHEQRAGEPARRGIRHGGRRS